MRFAIPTAAAVALAAFASTASAQQPIDLPPPSAPPIVVTAPPRVVVTAPPAVVVQRPPVVVVAPPPIYPAYGVTIARPGLTIGIGSPYPAYGYYGRPYYGHGYGHYHHYHR
jgi:hypothetical protein